MPKRGPGANDGCEPVIIVASMAEDKSIAGIAEETGLLRLLAENAIDYAIFVTDRDRRVLTWTPGAERLLRYGRDEILGRQADLFYTPEDVAVGVPKQEIEAALSRGRGEDDRWHVRKDGSRFWASGILVPLWDGEKTLRGFAKIMRDRTDWKLAEQARMESEGRLQALLNRLPQGAVYQVEVTPDGEERHFTYVSAGVKEICGIDPEEIVADARALYDCIHEEDRRRVAQAEAAALQSMGRFHCEFRLRIPSGDIRWLQCQSAPHRLGCGKIVWEGVILDVTTRKQAEVALRDQETRLSLALEAGRMGTWQWDLATNEMDWSPQLEAIHGLQPGSFPGKFEAFQHNMHPDDREAVLASLTEAIETGNEHHVEYRLVRPDGSMHWVEARGKLFHDESGRPTRMVGVCMEIDERKKTELDLRFLNEASRSLASLVDYESTLQKVAGLAVPHFADWCTVYLPDGPDKLRQLAVAHIDPAKVQLAMELAERWPASPDVPGGPYTVVRTGRAVLIESIDDELLQQSAQDEEHLDALRKLGLKSYMGMPLTVRDETIGMIAFASAESGRRYTTADLAIAEDLARRAAIATENARLYAKLQEEGRRKDEFLAMLAHELRNPLAPIRSGIDLLGMMNVEAEILETMQQQVEHLTRLVDDLLDVSRVMRGRVELRREPVELSSIVARAAETLRPMIERHQQELTVAVAPGPVWLHADAMRLTQVVINLLTNASKYTEPGGKIFLSTEPQVQAQSPGVLIRVRDTGIGIDSEILPHVFGLFTQADRSLDRSQGGLGIGLTIVKSMVEAHDGNVTVRSDGPNQGSEFAVWLPTSPSPPEPSPVAANEPRATSSAHRILIVDDNVPAAKMLGLLLHKMGDHQVVVAYDGKGAIREAEHHRPDIILLDIGLPMMDGFEVVRQLRRRPPFRHTLIVALTGYGTDEDRRRALEAGFDHHLVKPPQAKDLQALLDQPRRGDAPT